MRKAKKFEWLPNARAALQLGDLGWRMWSWMGPWLLEWLDGV